MFKDICIRNFRGLEYLQLNNLERINVLVGKNNCGKSSALEAIFLLLGVSDPLIPLRLNTFRSSSNYNIEHLKFIFRDANVDNIPRIEGLLQDRTKRILYIEPNYAVATNDESPIMGTDNNKRPAFGLNIKFDICNETGGVEHHLCKLPVNSAQALQTPIYDNTFTESISAIYLLPHTKGGNVIQNLSTIIKRQKKDVIVSLLKYFDPRVLGIDILSDGIYLSIEGVSELLPLYMAGDGLRSFLDIMTAIVSGSYHIALIDEIDNGLHYMTHKQLWKALIEATNSVGCQLFVTTHNLECLDSLNHVISESENMRDEVAVYTISQTIKGVKSYRINGEGLQSAIEKEIEIRN